MPQPLNTYPEEKGEEKEMGENNAKKKALITAELPFAFFYLLGRIDFMASITFYNIEL